MDNLDLIDRYILNIRQILDSVILNKLFHVDNSVLVTDIHTYLALREYMAKYHHIHSIGIGSRKRITLQFDGDINKLIKSGGWIVLWCFSNSDILHYTIGDCSFDRTSFIGIKYISPIHLLKYNGADSLFKVEPAILVDNCSAV